VEPDTDASRAAPGGVFDSAKHLLASLIAHLHSRLALFATEFAEEKLRLTTLLYSALTALFLLFVTVLLALLFVIAAYWDTPYRLHAIGGLTLLFLIGAGIAFSAVRTQLQSRPRLFEASLGELYKDRQQLDSQ
jgi:uncharacterized membrane protein YqjE